MQTKDLKKCAERLHQARLAGREIKPLCQEFSDLTVVEAYQIQQRGVELRQNDHEKILGFKMGLTSEAKRKQMNLHTPIYGVLTDRMKLKDGQSHSLKGSIHPKIEPEIAFLTKKELKGKITLDETLSAIDVIFPALEILDSRYEGFKYFSLPDVIADNSSSSLFVLGKAKSDFQTLDFSNLYMTMKVNGQIAHEAKSNVISGNPLNSIIQLCGLLEHTHESLPSGSLVLAGAATPAIALEPGMKVQLEVDAIPSVSLLIMD